MESAGAILDQPREQVAIGPGNLLEVELEAGIAESLCLLNEGAAQRSATIGIGKDRMTDARINIFIDDQRDDGDSARMCGVDDIPPCITGDAAVSICVVPGGAEHIDLTQVGHE